MWNIILDGTITHYTPHTITIDTPKRKNTVIRKSDKTIATETIPDKPRLIDFVACKTVGEYKRNREKIKKFYLDEKKKKEKPAEEQTREQKDESQLGTSKQVQQRENKTVKRDSTTKQTQKQRKGKQDAPKGKQNNRLGALTSHNLKLSPNRLQTGASQTATKRTLPHFQYRIGQMEK